MLLIGLVAVVVIAGAGFGLMKVLGGKEDPSTNGKGNGGDETSADVSAEATQTAADALEDFPQSAQDCFALELDEDPDLLSALAPVAADFGFRFDDPAIAEAYADAMAGCVERDDLAENLASGVGSETEADCVRKNARAWTDDEARDFIRDAVDSSRISSHNAKITSLLIC